METRELYLIEFNGELFWHPIYYTKKGAKCAITLLRGWNRSPSDFKIIKIIATVEKEDEPT